MEKENKEIWNSFKAPPTASLKSIGAGRLKGKSSIDPMWRLMAMTDVFGPCGVGWSYEIIREWREEAGPEISVYVEVAIRIFWKDKWSAPIPGIGGAMLLAQESKGLHHSDESYKMALTDALSVAFKSLGMAADIYMGKFDGVKYNAREDLLQEPDPMTPTQITKLNDWKGFFQEIGHKNAGFVASNMTVWNKETAQIWITTFEKDFPNGVSR